MVRHFLAGACQGPVAVSEGAVAAACFAVAGPVQGGEARLTNLSWHLDAQALAAALRLERVELVNDFAVLIYGLPHLAADQQAVVREGGPDPMAPLLILGAGTGLGVAIGVPPPRASRRWPARPPTASSPHATQQEWELKQWLRADLALERVSIERVVSGTGLGHVARWLLQCRDPAGDHPLQRQRRPGARPQAVRTARPAGRSGPGRRRRRSPRQGGPGALARGLRQRLRRSGPHLPQPRRHLAGGGHRRQAAGRAAFGGLPGGLPGQGAAARRPWTRCRSRRWWIPPSASSVPPAGPACCWGLNARHATLWTSDRG